EVLSIDDEAGLLALVQAGVLEIHPWGSTLADPERPDRVVFDLDPDEGLDWTAVVDAAVAVRGRLQALGLVSFLKTTGGKGLHVVAPLRPKASWDAVKAFALSVAEAMARDEPDRFTATVSKRARTGRIYVDYLRNGRGATAVAAYSTRARPRAPVSTPLAWDELSADLRPNHFTVETLPTRLRHLGADPWAGLADVDQTAPAPPRRRRC
ncbi:MAG TPA: non-homologous end-joining DNA ligase, partial [Methylomirabilota bacterium]|nr:non-homologous end-joining DNA ligase [Methylomirabilota bacterium]